MKRLIAAVLCFFGPATASAVPIEWALEDVFFIDNGTASGSFFYDADTGLFSNVAIVTTGGAPADLYARSTDRLYESLTGDANGASGTDLAYLDGPYLMSFALFLTFDDPLTNAGGTLGVGGYEELTGIDVSAYGTRLVVSGNVSSVPAPAALWPLASGLACLGRLGRRRPA